MHSFDTFTNYFYSSKFLRDGRDFKKQTLHTRELNKENNTYYDYDKIEFGN